MLRRMWTVFRRELAASRSMLLIVGGLIGVWNGFLYTRLGRWQEGLPEMLSLWPVFLVLPWIALASIQAWSRERQQGSIHYTLALPLPGWVLPAVKGVAAVTETGILGLTAAIAGWPLYGRVLGFDGDPVAQRLMVRAFAADVLKLGVMLAVILFTLSLIIQLGYIVGRSTGVVPAVIIPVTIGCGIWAVFRAGGWLSRALAWLPPLTLSKLTQVGRTYQFHEVYLGTAPAASTLLLGLGFLGITAWLTTRQMDV